MFFMVSGVHRRDLITAKSETCINLLKMKAKMCHAVACEDLKPYSVLVLLDLPYHAYALSDCTLFTYTFSVIVQRKYIRYYVGQEPKLYIVTCMR